MKIRVRETVLGIKTVTIKEVDQMQCRCTVCLMWNGAAVKTEKLKLKLISNVWCLVCRKHENVTTLNRREYYEQKRAIHNPSMS